MSILCLALFSFRLIILSRFHAPVSLYFSLWKASLDVSLAFDVSEHGSLFICLVAFIALALSAYSQGYIDSDMFNVRFIIILFSFVSSMLVLIASYSWIALLLGWDGLGLRSFFLVHYYYNWVSNLRAFITVVRNRIGDIFIIMLLAIRLIDFNVWVSFRALVAPVVCLVLFGAITKRALFPYCVWLPEAMAAPTPVSSLVHSSTLVTGGLFLILLFSSVLTLAASVLLWGVPFLILILSESFSHLSSWMVIPFMVKLPLADGLKLFVKGWSGPFISNVFIFYLCPLVLMVSSYLVWSLPAFGAFRLSLKVYLVLFMLFTRLGVYSTLGSGWASNSCYAILGTIRSIAQTVSYEVSLVFLLISCLFFRASLRASGHISSLVWVNIALLVPAVAGVWVISIVAETNRAPFDFAEGESELVSGFNVEYGSVGFAILFIAEYSRIIIFTILTSNLIFSQTLSVLGGAIVLVLLHLFIWCRASYPRSRYDSLILLCWLAILPGVLGLICILQVFI